MAVRVGPPAKYDQGAPRNEIGVYARSFRRPLTAEAARRVTSRLRAGLSRTDVHTEILAVPLWRDSAAAEACFTAIRERLERSLGQRATA